MIYAVNIRSKEHKVLPDYFSQEASFYLEGGERWDIVRADADGWIKWEGGKCPLPRRSRFDAKLRDGTFAMNEPPTFSAAWDHQWGGADIIAYRPILDADTKPEAPAWNGEGLPPVGCECEAYDHEQGEWVQGRMLMHGNNDHAFASGSPDGWKKLFWAIKFRPIRSEEDVAVEEIARIIADGHDVYIGAHEAAERIYRAGYRKTGGE